MVSDEGNKLDDEVIGIIWKVFVISVSDLIMKLIVSFRMKNMMLMMSIILMCVDFDYFILNVVLKEFF